MQGSHSSIIFGSNDGEEEEAVVTYLWGQKPEIVLDALVLGASLLMHSRRRRVLVSYKDARDCRWFPVLGGVLGGFAWARRFSCGSEASAADGEAEVGQGL